MSSLRFDRKQVPKKYTPFLAIDSVYFRWALKSVYECASKRAFINEVSWLEKLASIVNLIKPNNRTQFYFKRSLEAIILLFDSNFDFG